MDTKYYLGKKIGSLYKHKATSMRNTLMIGMSISNAIPSKNIWITSTIVQGNSLKFEGSLKSLSVAFGIKLAGT